MVTVGRDLISESFINESNRVYSECFSDFGGEDESGEDGGGGNVGGIVD